MLSVNEDLRAAGGDFAQLALNNGLVDELAPRAGWRQALMDEYGSTPDGTSFNQIHFQAYLAATDRPSHKANEIAVITAQGEIVMGEGPVTVSAAETLVGHIRDARNNPNTAAILLRVDSPGGSVFASELSRQELVLAVTGSVPRRTKYGPHPAPSPARSAFLALCQPSSARWKKLAFIPTGLVRHRWRVPSISPAR
mgnify:CR=1 FL=1